MMFLLHQEQLSSMLCIHLHQGDEIAISLLLAENGNLADSGTALHHGETSVGQSTEHIMIVDGVSTGTVVSSGMSLNVPIPNLNGNNQPFGSCFDL